LEEFLFYFSGTQAKFSECSTPAPVVWRMASGLEGFLEEVMRRHSEQAHHERLGRCLKAYASRRSCAGAPPYKPNIGCACRACMAVAGIASVDVAKGADAAARNAREKAVNKASQSWAAAVNKLAVKDKCPVVLDFWPIYLT
jgi:hypothetical protein